jgi:hypothetical protein
MKVAPIAAINATIGIDVMMSAIEPVTSAAMPMLVYTVPAVTLGKPAALTNVPA